MAKHAVGYTSDDDEPKPTPLTRVEKASVRRAEADLKSGRVRDHDAVAEELRLRARTIVERARKAAKPR